MRLKSRIIAVGSAVVLMTPGVACGQVEAENAEETGPLQVGEAGYDRELAERMSEHLMDGGFEGRAEDILDEENATLTLRDTPYLEQWEIYEVANDAGVHREFWYIATDEEGSAPLTNFPAGFAVTLEFDPGEIVDVDMALIVAHDYIAMTDLGSTDMPLTILDSVEDIDVGARTEEDRPRLREEFGEVIEPMRVAQDTDGVYTVVAYTQLGLKLQRRTITFDSDGHDLTDDTETLSERLTEPAEPTESPVQD